MHKCPNCNTDIKFTSVYSATTRKPYKCKTCKSELFQFRFASVVAEAISMLIATSCGYLLILMQWKLIAISLSVAAILAYGSRAIEAKYSQIRILVDQTLKGKQIGLSFVGYILGMVIFFPLFFNLLEKL